MSRRAWVYLSSVMLLGLALIIATAAGGLQTPPNWLLFAVLTVLATVAHLFEAAGPNNETWNSNLTFYYAGVLLLPPFYFALLVLIPHLIHWAVVRLRNGPTLRQWYIQPFNIATHLIAGLAAYATYSALCPAAPPLAAPLPLFAALLGVVVYVTVNHFLIAAILVLARGHSWRESGLFDVQNFLSDSALACLGYVIAVLWQINPWLILPALTPLLMTYRALRVPQLQQEATIDSKTGLYNAHHFNELFAEELQRAKRFNRPLAVVMSDLDLLRNVNNTYGHLAGDAVLSELGRLIRASIREYDIAARFGGEEFSIVILEAGMPEARAFAERLRRTIERAEFSIPTSSTPIHVTMSLGVACFPSDATSANDLLHTADVAVYQAKLRGRNAVVCATDIPQSVPLDSAPLPEEPSSEYQAAHLIDAVVSREEPVGEPEVSAPSESTTPLQSRSGASRSIRLFVGAIVLLGITAAVLGTWNNRSAIDWPMLAVLAALAAAAELLQVRVYGFSTVSVSVAINFAAAMTAGMPGVVVVSAVIVLIHFIQVRPAVYQSLFNWATHVLAGSLPIVVLHSQSYSMDISTLLAPAALAVVTAVGYYAVDTGLVAMVIALDQKQPLLQVWRQQFSWLMSHYVVLCLMGAFQAVAYEALGLAGLIIFALPPFMMRYAQKQYVERTEASMRELQRMNAELSRANQEVTDATRAIHELNEELFLVLAKIVDARDPYVSDHTTQVAEYAAAVAEELRLPPAQVEQIRQAALLHDIGKIGLSEQLLHKPARLTPEEYAMVQKHVIVGAELLETCQGLRQLVPLVKYHHEWWNGAGYPQGLRGENIPLGARILAVCDAVEAMASDRPYSHARSQDEIVAELHRMAGTQFDQQVVEAFVRTAGRRGASFIVNSAREIEQHQTPEDAMTRQAHLALIRRPSAPQMA
jgi:diguanylate cyclase (GGDEF)-like protein/putative nucleotidyltransferase with HDIG domain